MILPVGARDPNVKQKLESRAARFGITPESSTSKANNANITKPTDSKLVARAARFADLTKQSGGQQIASVSSKPISVSTNKPEDANKLAKRAQRFGDIPIEQLKAKTVKTKLKTATTNKSGNSDILAQRAARFANVGSK